ncbi:MAG: mechanosensitive ion channel [Ginsengibacter sp.]|jgi:small-conductance mechanosensitive channel
MNLDQAFHLVFDKLQLWLSELIKMLPNLALATVILVVGLFLAKRIRSLAKKIFKKFSLTSTLVGLAVNFVYILFIGIVIFTALKVLHLDTTITTMLASAGVLGLALAFAFQDIAANFISGIFISFRKPFGVGDMIKVKDYTGKVEEIRLRDTTIITFQGQVVTIPNKDVFQNPIENYTKYGKRRVDIKSGVSQGDDLNKAKKIALEAVADLEGILKEETSFYFDGLGESTINFTLRLWVNTGMQVNYLQVQSDAIIKIKEAFEQNDISLPFPIRTLDFGMKGGKTLADMAIQVANNSQTKDEKADS